MAIVAAALGALNIAGGLFKGSSLPAAMRDHQAYIDSVAARGDIQTLTRIAEGSGPVGPVPPWNQMVNYGVASSHAEERPQQRAYAAGKLQQLQEERIRSPGAVLPVAAVASSPAVSLGSLDAILTAAGLRGINASTAEAATRVGAGAAQVATNAQAGESRASLLGVFSGAQVAVAGVVVVLVVLLVFMVGRRGGS